MTAARMRGGPQDEHVLRRAGATWPIYTDDVGRPVTARAGDRELIHRPNRGLPTRWGYALQTAAGGGVEYVHHTLLSPRREPEATA